MTKHDAPQMCRCGALMACLTAVEEEEQRAAGKLKPLKLDIHSKCRVCLGPIIGRNRNATLCRSADCQRLARAEKRAAR